MQEAHIFDLWRQRCHETFGSPYDSVITWALSAILSVNMLICAQMNIITHFFLSSWCFFAFFYFLPFCIGSCASLSATLSFLRLWFLLVAKEGIATTMLHPWPSEVQATPLICGILCVSPCSSTPHCRAWQVRGEGENAVPAKHAVKLTVSSRMCRWLLEEIPRIAGIGEIFLI